MFAEPFDSKDGYRIWLDREEVDLLIANTGTREERLAFELGVRSGLRVSEIVDVKANHVVDTSAGPRVRVYDSKGKEYRESPTTTFVHAQSDAVADLQDSDAFLVDHSKRWVQRHLDSVCEDLAEQTGDDMWLEVSPHDLRRSWATLLSADVDDPLLIMDWGGWEDMDTFLEHYRGSYSPHVQREFLQQVDWLPAESKATDTEPELRMLQDESVSGL